MTFWKMAWEYGWADIDTMRMAVKTDLNPFGEITKEEFKEITGPVSYTHLTLPTTPYV